LDVEMQVRYKQTPHECERDLKKNETTSLVDHTKVVWVIRLAMMFGHRFKGKAYYL